MACISQHSSDASQKPQFPETIVPTFSRARRPALIPPNCFLSQSEADEIIGTRIQQPLFPPPDHKSLQHVRPASPSSSDITMTEVSGSTCKTRSRESSPASKYSHSIDAPTMPKALSRDPRRRAAWLKARAQYARDQQNRQSPVDDDDVDVWPDQPANHPPMGIPDYGPKRKHSAFVKEQELQFLIEDRVGTPHISELHLDDDVSAQAVVEELGIVGAVAALVSPEGVGPCQI
ncbi:hypothetical protein BS50DRAFT_1984 [Corynespora cassiicola Philippines]|uniref:Uncharacterized protein n=1 Tax=Corynespora cassiicola Philippines TaxID=1448308 RepID=A0A2T2P880_CORCC|nr:hypothetical protein BS50DRAFT_1984 [Corynespora cassiicola Philippines]